MPSLGEFRTNTKYRKARVWVCHRCLKLPIREHRQGQESPIERRVREALQLFGEWFVAESKVGAFIYDFAFPNLNLLLEVDSRTWHHSKRKRLVDAVKHANAEAYGWKLVRVFNGPKLGNWAVKFVRARRKQLIRRFEKNPEIVKIIYQEKYGNGRN